MNFKKIVNPVLFIVISLIWGSSFILIKLGMFDAHNQPVLSAYQVASIRVLTAGLVLVPFFLKNKTRYSIQTWGYMITSGLLGTFIPAYLFCMAEIRLDSNLAGILNALTPFFTILVGVILFRKPIPGRQIAGIVTGFAGIVLLFVTGGNIHFDNLSYAFLVILATICYGLNVNLVRSKLGNVPAMTIVSLSFAALIIPALIILYLTGYFLLPLTRGTYLASTAASGVLGILGSAVAYILFYMLIKRSSAVFASSVTFVIPVVALGWGWFYGESISIAQIVCLFIILAGVFLTRPIVKKTPAL